MTSSEQSPGEVDRAVFDAARRVMSRFDPTGFTLDQTWSAAAQMWFTEIEPAGGGPVSISLAHGGDTLNVSFGTVWFEYLPFDLRTDLPALETLLEALTLGRFEVSGRGERSSARVDVDGRTWRVGHVRWPVPWRWRRRSTFSAYPQ